MSEYTIGLDVGSSSVKASIFEIKKGEIIGSCTSPKNGQELQIIAPEKGWAQQDPNIWWEHVKSAIGGALADSNISKEDVEAIGVSYQMHGMTPVDADGNPLMDAIVWCDGRTAKIKESIENNPKLVYQFLEESLNLPGHFTASKSKWFKDNCQELYQRLDKILLPGHYILRRATGQSTVTASGLSEGIFWNFKDMCLSDLVMDEFGLDKKYIPEIKPTFGEHGKLTEEAAGELGLRKGIPFTYFAGDQPNNAFSLNVLNPGEVAATAGTSAVVYGITDKLQYDIKTRVNQFLHVNSTTKKDDLENLRIGILACINGAGISYRWAKDNLGGGDYEKMNELAASVETTDSLFWVPFGNGPERTQEDKNTGAHLIGLDLNRHKNAHIFRAIQEGVVYAIVYGVNVMREMGMPVERVRAGNANMFKSELFRQIFAETINVPLEIYDTDGSAGAARGAAVGLGTDNLYSIFSGLKKIETIEPTGNFEPAYDQWCKVVNQMSK